MKLVIFVIALNEEKTLGKVLDLMPKSIKGVDQIEKLVVSDGSQDKTVEIAREHGARVIEGHAQKRLAYRFQQAVEECLKMGADIAVNIDADLQFNPADIPTLVDPILNHGYNFVAADRFTDPETGLKRKPENMPGGKYYANLLGAWIVGKLSGYKFNDVTCGFRAYDRKALLSLNINSKYTYTQESFQVLAVKKLNMTSMPVLVKYFPGRKSRVVTNFFQFLFGSAINIMRAFRDQAPLTFFLGLGAFPLLSGLLMIVGLGIYYLITRSFSPYKFVGFGGIYLFSLGLFLWGLGLMADMLDRSNTNQEKIIERLKHIEHEK
ncbi:glycosyltransferase family 2 protein [Candidatus Nomurabacteria bacterium]|nr:glycosyltransferase family 2 protein [Candidatus Nomurabacteria bacterium]MCB9803605.1 glycosyltransferase family 2 protein [Candidatus Nomurabacteria bacterium]